MHDVALSYTWRSLHRLDGDTTPPSLVVHVTLLRHADGKGAWAGLHVTWRDDAAPTMSVLDDARAAHFASLLAATGLPARVPHLSYRCHSGLFGYEARLVGTVDGQPFAFRDGGWAVREQSTYGSDASAWKALVAELRGEGA